MDFYSALQYVLFVAIVTALVKPLGGYMERVFSRKQTALDRLCLPVERLIYRVTAVDAGVEMSGKEYATCFVLFGLAGTLLLYAILRMQQFLPWFFPQYISPSEKYPFFVGNSSDPFSFVWRPAYYLSDNDGGPELSTRLGGWSSTGTIAFREIER